MKACKTFKAYDKRRPLRSCHNVQGIRGKALVVNFVVSLTFDNRCAAELLRHLNNFVVIMNSYAVTSNLVGSIVYIAYRN